MTPTIEHGENCDCCDKVGKCDECGERAALQWLEEHGASLCMVCYDVLVQKYDPVLPCMCGDRCVC